MPFEALAKKGRPQGEPSYGDQAEVWRRRWRLFFLATAGLFGHCGGPEWG